LAVAALNQSIDVAAAEPFRQVLQRMFTTDRRDSALGLPAVPLDELFVQPATRYLHARGGTVDTGSRAHVELARDGGVNGDIVVRLRDEVLRPPAVIVATAWHALPDVLPPIPALQRTIDDAAATGASAIVTVNLWLDRAVEGEAFIGLPGRAMQWVFDKQQLFGGRSTHLSVVSSGADALAVLGNDEIAEIARRELAASLPALRDASITRTVVVRERRASFSLAPGQPRRPGTETGVAGVLLAGDWIDTGLPATIESAAISGHRAAAAAVQHLARH
jgi:zeta-carotene desaturase